MRRLYWICLVGLVFILGCQSQEPFRFVILDGHLIHVVTTDERIPYGILKRAGVVIGSMDQILYNGVVVKPMQVLPVSKSATLQIRRAVPIIVDGRSLQSTAMTVGEALSQPGNELFGADRMDPPADTAITDGMAINYIPAQDLSINIDKNQVHIRSSEGNVGSALAQAGLPLIGLDRSQPSDNQSSPQAGNILGVRTNESIILAQKIIPFSSDFQDSPMVQLGQEEILQPGINGVAIIRTLVRYEDGKEVARQTEAEAIVRPPQNRIVARGTKIALTSTTVGGVTIQYWRALQMYATVYTSSATASGLPAGKGVVAVDPALYSYLNGQRIYVPGYGYAVIGDLGGGYIVEQKLGISRYRWIDLGFSENNLVDMTGWVTVYFLPPAPPSIPDALK